MVWTSDVTGLFAEASSNASRPARYYAYYAYHNNVLDDTTLTELLSKHTNTDMPTFLTKLLTRANENDMEINTTKTKEMILGPVARTNLPLHSTPTGTTDSVTILITVFMHLCRTR